MSEEKSLASEAGSQNWGQPAWAGWLVYVRPCQEPPHVHVCLLCFLTVFQENLMKAGMLAGIFACVFGILGILFLGIVFVPLGFITAIIGTIGAVKSKDIGSIGVNVLGWVLVIIGFFTSPVLLALIGIGALQGS
jgi:hypothetical protein